jgi:hypothetical protein
MNDETNEPLTYPLGDKLKLVVPMGPMGAQPSAPRKRSNPRSGVDFEARDLRDLTEVTTQNSLDSRDKNNGKDTASRNLNPQNKETHMTIQAINTNTNTTASNATNVDFDSRALSIAESAVRSIEKVAHEGITVRPAFKKRDALGSAILGGAIGGAIGGAAAATAMAFLPEARTNGDVLNAGALGFGAGTIVGAGIGYFVGTREPKDPSKK